MREFLGKIPFPDAEKLYARRVSAFVAISTLIVALLASAVDWNSGAKRLYGETDCEQDLEKAGLSTIFPFGRENTFSRIQIIELKPDAFMESPIILLNPWNSDKPFCPNIFISLTDLPQTNSIKLEVSYPRLTDQLSDTNKSIEFPANLKSFEIGLEGDDITFSKAYTLQPKS